MEAKKDDPFEFNINPESVRSFCLENGICIEDLCVKLIRIYIRAEEVFSCELHAGSLWIAMNLPPKLNEVNRILTNIMLKSLRMKKRSAK